ncbi:hypothetical protein AVEN_65523-1 [Araneus ventricosus]|uniref:Reverse transcriptase domain-containing protein n=1 Tax=Araneus ventricosus TaxID=182803 RepID=A0A4Y2W205_ARAVE|nr:hypothetical protein AVEN_65523-1 [Araneus ventricosus]
MIPIDSLQIPKEHLPLNIKLADPYFYRPGKIDVLLGAELESIGIKDDPSYNEVDQSLETFEKTVRHKNNRYEVELPWKRDWHELNDNYSVAKKKLDLLVRRFKKNPDLNLQYRETLHDYEKNGIIEKVPNPENPINKSVFYMRHQPVLNKFAFISDIEKAFLQLTLAEKDRDALRFLWTENDTLQVYRFNRVLFGVRSSPFLLSASIKTHLKKFHDEFPTTTECLNRCFYVDDFISGADSLQDALEISTQAVSIMDQASMVLRKWTTNSDELRQFWKREGLENQLQDNPISPSVNPTKVLEMLWNTVEDHLIVATQSLVHSLSNNENTKRHLLRAIGKIFDPLGLLSPFTIRLKCILQVLWMKEISWGEELPPDIQKTWCQWVSEVPRLSELQVPRYVFSSSTGEPTDVLELHCFCDASQKAYGVVIYTRVVKDCNVEVNLLVSKSRVAPLTKITLPRLELLDALLAARLASKVKPIVDLKRPSKVFFWTDSKITLHWIKRSSKRWKSFVSNRVTEIQSLCDTSAWAHYPGKQNPADFLSRGVNI